MPELVPSSELRTIRAKALELATRTAQEAAYYPAERAARPTSIADAMKEQSAAILTTAEQYAAYIAGEGHDARRNRMSPGSR